MLYRDIMFKTINNVKHMFQYVIQSSLFQLCVTFMILHILQYSAIVLYYSFCIDLSVFGFIRSLIISHNPVCHALMTMTYHSQNQIGVLFQNLTISTGITWIYQHMIQH